MSEELREPLLPEEVILDDSESDASDNEEGGVRAIILSRLKAVGRVTTDGLTSKYADTFSAPLERLMSEKEFRAAIGAINQTLADYFPCLCCVVYAYVGYVATCGLMSCCARPCTSEVEENVRRVLRRINRKHIFQSKGIHWRLKRSRCSSWIEISHCPQKDQRRVSITVPANRRMSIPIASGQRSPIIPSPHAPPDPGSDRRHSALS